MSSESAAAITTAASAGWGRFCSNHGRNNSRIATIAAPASPVTCDFEPACSATAVREPLAEIANPWKRPAATFAAPIPIISWFGSISSPRRAAKLVEVAIVSVSDTSTIPSAAISSGPRSLTETCGIDGVGRPCGNAPTVFTPFSPRSSSAVATVAPTTATSTAGTRVVIRGRIIRTASVATPITSAVVFVWSSPDTNAFVSSMKPSASVENPKSFGSWPTMIVIARPFMYPTCTSLDRRSATNPSLPRPSPISMAPTISAIIPARAIAVLGSGTRRRGAIAAKIRGDTDESGPSTRIRDGPRNA